MLWRCHTHAGVIAGGSADFTEGWQSGECSGLLNRRCESIRRFDSYTFRHAGNSKNNKMEELRMSEQAKKYRIKVEVIDGSGEELYAE